MSNSYTHLTLEERVILGYQRMDHWSLSEIAEDSGRHEGTICRELRRNRESRARFKRFVPFSISDS